MALIGNIIAMSDHGNPSSTINYNLFVPAFALLTLFWLVPAAIWERVQGHPAIVFIIDLLNTIFAFCGAIALPAKLHAPNCSNDVRPIPGHLLSDLLSCPSLQSLTPSTGKNTSQLHHPLLELSRESMPRGPGRNCVPVVPLVCVLDIDHHFGPADAQGNPRDTDGWQTARFQGPPPDGAGLKMTLVKTG